jgi:farnesyl diphosphate synthase
LPEGQRQLNAFVSVPEASEFERRLSAAAELTERTLGRLLAEENEPGEIFRPPLLLAAMRHAALGGGKRFRAFLLIECARLFGAAPERSALAAAAMECVHCYSLVHDDLPAMDDDDFRRGAPTVHKAFGDATAILAGDALLTLAFDVLARPEAHADPRVRAALAGVLARAAGVGGMAGGQMLDLLAESVAPDDAEVRRLQAMKTGALIAAACEMGALLGGADDDARNALVRYGRALGLAFQIADDLIDREGSPAVAGKATGKDVARGKATLVALLGVDAARALLADTVGECEGRLAALPGDTAVLASAARFAAERKT